MSNAFLAALQAQSSTIQTDRAATTPTAPKPNKYMAGPKPLSGKQALKQILASAPIATLASAPLATAPVAIVDHVDIDESRNRIDVYFTGIPDKTIRDTLKAQGFWFWSASKSWFHKDTEANRQFLRDTFKLDIAPKAPGAPVLPQIVVPEPMPEPTTESTDSEAYSLFKRQVNELIAELKVEPADLMLLAIDCLHSKTFKS